MIIKIKFLKFNRNKLKNFLSLINNFGPVAQLE